MFETYSKMRDCCHCHDMQLLRAAKLNSKVISLFYLHNDIPQDSFMLEQDLNTKELLRTVL